MSDVSTFRLYVLRATYVLVFAGLALMIGPGIVNHAPEWTHLRGVVHALLGGVGLLALLGVRHPLRMLPLLLFEITWKSIWLLAFALPLWRAGRMTDATWSSVRDCLPGVVLLAIVVPWPYVIDQYFIAPGDRWTGRPVPTPGGRS